MAKDNAIVLIEYNNKCLYTYNNNNNDNEFSCTMQNYITRLNDI